MTGEDVRKIKEEDCTYASTEKKLSNSKKDFKWVVSVTKKKKEKENRIGKL